MVSDSLKSPTDRRPFPADGDFGKYPDKANDGLVRESGYCGPALYPTCFILHPAFANAVRMQDGFFLEDETRLASSGTPGPSQLEFDWLTLCGIYSQPLD